MRTSLPGVTEELGGGEPTKSGEQQSEAGDLNQQMDVS
jgi:hypothetical protein